MGLTLGSCTVARTFGPSFLVARIRRAPRPIDYGKWRNLSACKVVQLLLEESPAPE
jgi:hypothetical protein